MSLKRWVLLPLVMALSVTACLAPNPLSVPPRIHPTAAMAMPDEFSLAVAEEILELGGNAVDAAVASAFALAVTYPEAGNIGGGGFMLLYMDGKPAFLDYRETAPAAATRDMYLDAQGDVIEDLSLVGHKAAGVPGTVAGMWAAHYRYGLLTWKEILQPAITLAEDGYVVHPQLAVRIREESEAFAGRTNFDQSYGRLDAGHLVRQPDLAATLTRIMEHGKDDFYQGRTAELIAAEMRRGGGLITTTDLKNYRPVWREPLKAWWRGYQVLTAPLPSSGGFAVIQLLKMKDVLAELFAGLAHNSAQYMHLIAEMEKRVFADRAEYLGDPDYFQVRINELIDPEYIETRALEVNSQQISTLDAVQPGLESHDTTHFSITDRWGNAVSNTYTLNTFFGSGVVVDGAGFLLNNEMDDFSAKPGEPNVYGVVGRQANAIEPGKRMLSSMAPTILLEDDRVAMVVGTSGGSTIFTSVFQVIINILDFGMSAEAAVGASRFHHQLLPPDLITYSPSRPPANTTISELTARGYRLEAHDWEFGDVQVIWKNNDNYNPASDPRWRGESRVLY